MGEAGQGAGQALDTDVDKGVLIQGVGRYSVSGTPSGRDLTIWQELHLGTGVGRSENTDFLSFH